MRTIGIDIETYSSADLQEVGVHRYVESPDFEILIIGYKLDGEEVHQIDLTSPTRDTNYDEQKKLNDFRRLLYDPEVLKTAFNASFERTCLAKWSGKEMPPEQWSDTMILSLELGLPGSLAGAGIALGLPEDQLKDPKGKELIRFFSKPCKPTKANGERTRNLPEHDPEKWQDYLAYNRQDVVTEHAIRSKVCRYKFAPSEQALWCLDQRMNDRGIRIDVDLAKKIVDFDAVNQKDLAEEAMKLTGLSNPNSVMQLKGWLEEQGYPVDSITKDSVAELLSTDLSPKVRRVLEIRQARGKTSTAKYGKMLGAVCEDDRIKGILQFYGASRSGRWAGRLVQVHNLARNTLPDLKMARDIVKAGDFDTLQTLYGEPSFVFSELVRTAFIPSEGCRFVVSDFSAIEARVIAWLADEDWVIKAFRDGKDIYCETASMMYHVPVEKHGQNGELRQKGKIATLACGYQGGVGAMKAMDSSGSIPEEEMQSIVNDWRAANPNIVQLWWDTEAAVKTCIREKIRVSFGGKVIFRYLNGNLFIRLPSGRRICYWGMHIGKDDMGRDKLLYKGLAQTKKWTDVETYGGKLVENIVQATARDCLADAMTRVTGLGYNIVMHIHDEMVVDVPKEDIDAARRIDEEMSKDIEWAPGLPLKGGTYECDFYQKD